MSYQKTTILGNIGTMELGSTPDGTSALKFSVAVSEKYKAKSGQQVESTEWFNCQSYGKQAEIIDQYFQAGSQILVEARKKTNKWQDKETGQNRYAENFIVKEFSFVDRKTDNGAQNQNNAPQQQSAPQQQNQQNQQMPQNNDMDDSIPF